MRYYRLEFVNPQTGEIADVINSNDVYNNYAVFESHPNGIYNPGCLEISFDCVITESGLSAQPYHITLHNVPKSMLGMARLYNSLDCNLYAGFKTGLPLANPYQSGLIAKGTVQGCYGNWAGTNLTMDFLINPVPRAGSPYLNLSANIYSTTPQFYSFSWTPPNGNQGGTFIEKLDSFFRNLGYAGCVGNIDANNKYGINAMPKFSLVYTTMEKFAAAIQRQTQLQNPPNSINPSQAQNNALIGNFQPYTGVVLYADPVSNYVIACDGTAPPPANPSSAAASAITKLQLQEFVGQPTWISAAGIIQSIHPMRNDIRVNNFIQYPNGIQSNIIVPASSTTASQFYYFNGENLKLQVLRMRHVGRYRDPSPTAWVTYIDADGGLREDQLSPYSGTNTTGQIAAQSPYGSLTETLF